MVCFTIQVILGSFPRGGMSGALKFYGWNDLVGMRRVSGEHSQ